MLNSYDEFTKLKEVVVGSPFCAGDQVIDLSFRLFFHDSPGSSTFWYPYYGAQNSNTISKATPERRVAQRYVEELEEDVEEFVAVLAKQAVVVHRPLRLQGAPLITTPAWKSRATPALNVRDQAIIFGDEIIETPPQIRARYFENDLLKPIFYRYFESGAKWTLMPRPVMTDQSFDLSHVKDVSRLRMAEVAEQRPSETDVGCEMMFDAAQCIRIGRDVLINVANRNHEKAHVWLARHFGERLRFHQLDRLADNHIDSIVLPLAPGTLLLRDRSYLAKLPVFLRNWKIIVPPPPSECQFPTYEEDVLVLTSPYIDMNVLSLDESTVVVNSLCPELIRCLEKNGFTVIPVRHRHRRLFAGGFHCFTLDTVRTGGLEDYT